MRKYVARQFKTNFNIFFSFAHNTIGVGGFVVNETQELLVVKERFRKNPHWKLPGGYVELGKFYRRLDIEY